MFGGGFAAFDGVPSPDEVQAQEQLHQRLEAALPVWLVCESPWRGSRYRVRVADSAKPGFRRLAPTMLQALDDRFVSAQLPRLELVRSNPEERVNHRFANTIAGVVLVKLPPVTQNQRSTPKIIDAELDFALVISLSLCCWTMPPLIMHGLIWGEQTMYISSIHLSIQLSLYTYMCNRTSSSIFLYHHAGISQFPTELQNLWHEYYSHWLEAYWLKALARKP